MATSEALVMIQLGVSSLGCVKKDAVAKASLIWVKAVMAVRVQYKGVWLFWAEESILFGGTKVVACGCVSANSLSCMRSSVHSCTYGKNPKAPPR